MPKVSIQKASTSVRVRVVLDQQADAAGHKQAFSSGMLVSGRPIVVLNNADQVAISNINFGYRGGVLDLNGNALNFKMINHTDSGATLVNHNSHEVANLAITGFTPEDAPFNQWDGNKITIRERRVQFMSMTIPIPKIPSIFNRTQVHTGISLRIKAVH